MGYSKKDMYILCDTETGGFDPDKHSLLTFSALALDNSFEIVDQLDMAIRHSTYVVDAEAIKKNRIDLVSHDKKAFDVAEAARKFRLFVGSNQSNNWNADLKRIAIGHNVSFDISFIKKTLSPDWNNWFSHHNMDTAAIAMFLQKQGKIPETVSLSLESLVKHFGLPVDTASLHNSLEDTKATLLLLKKLLSM